MIKANYNGTYKSVEDIKYWNDLHEEKNVEYIYTQNGHLLYSKYDEVEGVSPLTYKVKKAQNVKNYRIYGNTINGDSVGDLVSSGEHAGEYNIPIIIQGKNLLQNTMTEQIINGVTFIVNNDGSVSISCETILTETLVVPIGAFSEQGDYILSGGYNSDISIGLYANVNQEAEFQSCSTQTIFTKANNSEYICCIRIGKDTEFNNVTVYPMIRKKTVVDDTFEPYYESISTNIYLTSLLSKDGNNADYIDYATQKRYNIDGTTEDIVLPILQTINGMNTLTVNTSICPSNIYIKGKIKETFIRTVYYYSQDGNTLLGTEYVELGGNAHGLQETPVKPSTAQYDYTFVGWNTSVNATVATANVLNNITVDKIVYAAFNETVRTLLED